MCYIVGLEIWADPSNNNLTKIMVVGEIHGDLPRGLGPNVRKMLKINIESTSGPTNQNKFFLLTGYDFKCPL